MRPLHYTPSDPGVTGDVSPPKVWGLVLMVAGVAPIALFYLEIGPEVGFWTAFGGTVGLVLFGVGLYGGLGKGWARKIGDALKGRVEG